MNEYELLTLAKAQGVDPSTIQHEEREVQFLADLADDPVLALHLAFKGGTALRLVYLCDRYSDDLDFDLVRHDAPPGEILRRLEAVAKAQQLEITDAWVKRRTVLLEVRAAGWLRQLKIEVSSLPRRSGIKTLVRNVVTPVFPASVNVLTYPLSILLSGKILATLERPYRTPRDLYDLFWLLSRGVDEDTAYLRDAAGNGETRRLVRDRRALYEALREAVSAYIDAQIRSELGALLPLKQRVWVGAQLKDRTRELLALRLGTESRGQE